MTSDADNPDTRAIREMERRLAKREARREWRLWTFALIGILAIFGTLAIGVWLAPVLFMRGFK